MWFFKNKKQKELKTNNEKVEKSSWWRGLRKTSSKFLELFQHLFKFSAPEEVYNFLEERLLMADLGPKVTADILSMIKKEKIKEPQIILDKVKQYLIQLLENNQKDFVLCENQPTVALFIGVNGAGKTTTIGKIGEQFKKQNKKVIFAAGDTYRAAAIDQLKIWGERLNIPVISQKPGADSAAVIFDAYQATKARKYDLLLADTAGRLHNNSNLMNELKKIERCLKKQNDQLPQEIILILDASIGQNALQQVEEFSKNLKVTGLILTKMDGSAKGGAIFSISKTTKLPIYYVGVGEKSEDLLLFNPKKFVEAIFED